MNIPIIRLEVEGMKYAIKTALTQHAFEIDTYIQEAVDQYCSDDNLRQVVTAQARAAIESSVKDEIDRFFRGAGRKAVADAVTAALLFSIAEQAS
jgi:hypothetical protein